MSRAVCLRGAATLGGPTYRLSSSPMFDTLVWQYCTSSLKRNANALRLTCSAPSDVSASHPCAVSRLAAHLQQKRHACWAWDGFSWETKQHMTCLSLSLCEWPINDVQTVQGRAEHCAWDCSFHIYNMVPLALSGIVCRPTTSQTCCDVQDPTAMSMVGTPLTKSVGRLRVSRSQGEAEQGPFVVRLLSACIARCHRSPTTSWHRL